MSPAAKRMRAMLRLYGYETPLKLRLKFMIMVTFVMLTGAISAMVDNWANMEIRFQTFESLLKRVELMVTVAISSICVLPFILALRSVVMAGGLSMVETHTLPLPIELSSRVGKSSVPVYMVAFALQITFYALTLKISFVLYNSGIIAMQRVTAEMKLFTLIVNEVGRLVAKRGNSYNDHIVHYPEGHLDLHAFWRELVEHHYFICREVIRLNEGIRLTASAINQTLCITICVCLYYCMENVDFFTKVKDLSLLVCVLAIIFAFCATGQTLINEGEKMRDALVDWNWAQSPLWLQKNLLLILTRTNRQFQVKPFGIFSLDLRNSATVIRAAYSYFNLLQSVSKK